MLKSNSYFRGLSALLLGLCLSSFPVQWAKADLIYTLQNGSNINFTGSAIIIPNGLGFSVFPIIAQPGSSLSSALTGTFVSNVGSATLIPGGSMTQVSSMLGDIFSPTNVDVGNFSILSSTPITMSIRNITSPQLHSVLQVDSGLTNYSINAPPFVGSGSYPLTSTTFNISNLQYGTDAGLPTASFDFSANVTLPTTLPGVFVASQVSGHVLGISAVPEPSSMLLVGLVGCVALRARNRRDRSALI